MAATYCFSRRTAKHMLYTHIYNIDKLGAVKLPATCKWSVMPSVHKTVELDLNDCPKGSKLPYFSAVMSSLTITEALELSDTLRQAAKAAKNCPAAEKQKLKKAIKNIPKQLPPGAGQTSYLSPKKAKELEKIFFNVNKR